MNNDADALRREIEQTRERMSETVEALAFKADVSSRARDAVAGRIETVKESLIVARDALVDASAVQGAPAVRRATALARTDLFAVTLAAFVGGIVAGALVPLRTPDQHSSDDRAGRSAIPTR